MMKALLSVRLRAMFASMTAQSQQKKKKGKGTLLLFAFLYLYLAVVLIGAMCLLFTQLAEPYHMMGLDWLYFAMAGLMGLGFSVFGSVFMTQNQLYEAKDNDQLLAMPIKPSMILLSRMIPLLGLNLLFTAIVMVPASVVYAVLVQFSVPNLLLQLVGVLAVCFLAQAISCLMGWGLHLLLSKMNKSFASALYMVLFLGIYFSVYSQAGNIINSMAMDGSAIASGLRSWVWPIYALGMGCNGKPLYQLIFIAISAAAFALVYYILSATFLQAATSRRGGKRRKLDINTIKFGSPTQAILHKEWQHFLGSPVYLTNLGIGILMTALLAAAGVIFRGKLMEVLSSFSAMGMDPQPYIPLIICAILSFLTSMMFVSAPSVSLEGNNMWILKSMPVSTVQILHAKLQFHCRMTTPVTVLAGLVLAITYGCDLPGILLCALVPGLLTVLCGVLGMACGLKWAKLDWLNEAYPCKQGMAVAITMFSMMGIPLVLGLVYGLLASAVLSPILYLALCALVLAAMSFGFYRLIVTWGVRKWDSLI